MATSVQHVSADDTSSPAHQAPRHAPAHHVTYAHQQQLSRRVETASTAALRASKAPVSSRVSRDHQPAPASSSSSTDNSHSLHALRKSNRGETMPTTKSTTVLSGGPTPVLSSLNIQSQPLPHRNYPGTPGATRSTGRIGLASGANGNGMRPTAKASASALSHTLGSSSSLTTSPTRRSYTTAAAAAAAAAAANAALPSDDVLCRILGSCLPTVFEALAKFQYQQATSVLETFADEIASDTLSGDVRLEWRSWDAFAVMVRLAASCESAYHLMRYLQPDMIHTETLEQLYNKLVVLLNHLVDDIQPVLKRAQQRTGRQEQRTAASSTRSSNSTTTSGNGSASGGVQSITSDEALQAELERLTLDDLEYYHGLLSQAAQFFVLRVSMLGLYRGLATQRPPHKYTAMTKTLERLIKRYAQFDHALLATLKQSAIEELRTVKAAFDSEICMAQYDFTKSMVALHRFKTSLRMWSDHIDSVSEYPLFDESDDVDDDDTDDYLMSGSAYSYSNSIGSSTLQMQQHAAAAAAYADSQYLGASAGDVPAPPTGSLPRPQRESSFRRKSFTSALASAADMAAFAAASEQAVAAAAASANTPTESQNPFSRLISQRGNLLKRGLSVASLRSKIQAATTSLSSSHVPSSPPNALEHAILGSTPSVPVNGNGVGLSSSSMLTPSGGNGLNSVGGTGSGGSSGFSTTNSHTLAAEMMASAVAKQEREDGYALPVYQWSKRFYRSLVAKFTLYFHRWLEPFESRGDVLSPFDLTRFIRSPVGISYLQLIDVLLAKGSHRVEDGTASVMLILETDKLDNKGSKFYANGYLCPGSSHHQVKPDEAKPKVKKMGYAAKAAAASRSASSSTTAQPAPSTAGALSNVTVSSSSSDTNNSSSSQQSHSLFNLNVDTEVYEDDQNGDFAPLWGLRGWPAVFCYPQHEPPLQHWPNIVSLIMDNRYVLELQGGKGSVVHTERRLKTSYYITSVDPTVFLVLLLEGKRRPSEKTVQDFMQTMAENLQHNGVYQRGGGSAAAVSSSRS